MKTITEFFGPHLVRARSLRQEALAGGKAAEEIPAVLGEALKVEGEKLTHLLAALDAAGDRAERVKRVLVLQLNEGEKAPSGAMSVNGFHYVSELFPGAPQQHKPQRPEGKMDARGGKKGRGRRGRGGERGEGAKEGAPARRPREPRPPRAAQGDAAPVKLAPAVPRPKAGAAAVSPAAPAPSDSKSSE